jgi:hypothetical protein
VKMNHNSLYCTNASILTSNASFNKKRHLHFTESTSMEDMDGFSEVDKKCVKRLTLLFDCLKPSMYVTIEDNADKKKNEKLNFKLRGYISYPGCHGKLSTIVCNTTKKSIANDINTTKTTAKENESTPLLTWRRSVNSCTDQRINILGSELYLSGSGIESFASKKFRSSCNSKQNEVIRVHASILCGYASSQSSNHVTKWQYTITGMGDYRIGVVLEQFKHDDDNSYGSYDSDGEVRQYHLGMDNISWGMDAHAALVTHCKPVPWFNAKVEGKYMVVI